MKNRLTKNWGLKLGSFLFAVALWIIVTNINDPVISMKVSDVPVTIRNANLITDNGQIYEVLDGTDVIDTVTIMAPRSIIDSFAADGSNVVAVADMNDLTSLNTISIKLSTNKNNDKLESIRGSIDCVRLNIEKKKSKSFPLKTSTVGDVKEGYIVGDVSAEQNLVKISGPESVVSRITKAQAEVDVSGFTSNISTDCDIRFYDENAVEVSAGNLDRSITKVRVNVEILKTKTVPVTYAASGTPKDGYELTGEVSGTRNYVVIAGRAKVVDDISSINVPGEVLDVTDATENVTVTLDLDDYLPDGVIFAEDDFTGKVNVTAYIEQEKEREITLAAKDIIVKNIPDGFEAEITESENEYTITLVGLAAELDAVSAREITAEVDVAAWMDEQEMEELTEGSHLLPLDIMVGNENLTLKEEMDVRIHFMERNR